MAAANARFWNRIARKYASDKIADEAGYERTLTRTRDYLHAEHRVLEFGCGTGTTALRLAPCVADYLATDISAEMIAIAGEKQAKADNVAHLRFQRATLDDLTSDTAAFDIVLGFNILHLVANLPGSLQRVRRLLKPGGLLISKTPCLGDMNPVIRLAVPVMQAFGQAPPVITFTARQLEHTLVQAGFEMVATERHASKGKDVRPFIVSRR